jgi:SnoaL-like domain
MIIRKAYQDFAQGNIPAVLAAFDASIAWHVPGHSPLSGDYRGHDQIRGFFRRTMELSAGAFSIDVHNVLAKRRSHCGFGHCQRTEKRGFRILSGIARLANEGREGDRVPRVSRRRAAGGPVLVLRL